MAGEYRRKKGRKQVRLPDGVTVPVPCLTSISFIDPRDRYQETVYGIDNTAKASRVVHVDSVKGLYVERVDTWKIIDPHERYQEHHVTFDNKTGADTTPPSFTTHRKRHVYRYYKYPQNPDDSGAWIDSELIDELATVDAIERHQEKIHTLRNSTNAAFADGDLSGQADSNDPDLTIGEYEGTSGNPVRLDPFQNIVDWNSETEFITVSLSYVLHRGGTRLTDIPENYSGSDPLPTPPDPSYSFANNTQWGGYHVGLSQPVTCSRGTTTFTAPDRPVTHYLGGNGLPEGGGEVVLFGYMGPTQYPWMCSLVANVDTTGFGVDFAVRGFANGDVVMWRGTTWYWNRASHVAAMRYAQLMHGADLIDHNTGITYEPANTFETFHIDFSGVTVDLDGTEYSAASVMVFKTSNLEAESTYDEATGFPPYATALAGAEWTVLITCRQTTA